jgi:hypothetical protein
VNTIVFVQVMDRLAVEAHWLLRLVFVPVLEIVVVCPSASGQAATN